MKRIAVSIVAVLSLAFGVGSALADDDHDGLGKPTVETGPVPAWVLASRDAGGSCSKLPANTTITMQTGTFTSKTWSKKDRHGVTTFSNETHSEGTATDLTGHVYDWEYDNEFTINDRGNPDVFSGPMDDSFELDGHGPAHLRNGFKAVFTTDFLSFASFRPIRSFGDPISFPDGAAHCDPL